MWRDVAAGAPHGHGAARSAAVRIRRVAVTVVIAAVVAGVDSASKAAVTHHVVIAGRTRLLPPVVVLTRYDHPEAVTVADYIKVVGLLPIALWIEVANRLFIAPRLRLVVAVATGLGLGGAVGNAVEVIRRHAVTDWLLVNLPLRRTVVLDVADVAILVSAACLAAVVAVTLARAARRRGSRA